MALIFLTQLILNVEVIIPLLEWKRIKRLYITLGEPTTMVNQEQVHLIVNLILLKLKSSEVKILNKLLQEPLLHYSQMQRVNYMVVGIIKTVIQDQEKTTNIFQKINKYKFNNKKKNQKNNLMKLQINHKLNPIQTKPQINLNNQNK